MLTYTVQPRLSLLSKAVQHSTKPSTTLLVNVMSMQRNYAVRSIIGLQRQCLAQYGLEGGVGFFVRQFSVLGCCTACTFLSRLVA